MLTWKNIKSPNLHRVNCIGTFSVCIRKCYVGPEQDLIQHFISLIFCKQSLKTMKLASLPIAVFAIVVKEVGKQIHKSNNFFLPHITDGGLLKTSYLYTMIYEAGLCQQE